MSKVIRTSRTAARVEPPTMLETHEEEKQMNVKVFPLLDLTHPEVVEGMRRGRGARRPARSVAMLIRFDRLSDSTTPTTNQHDMTTFHRVEPASRRPRWFDSSRVCLCGSQMRDVDYVVAWGCKCPHRAEEFSRAPWLYCPACGDGRPLSVELH